MFRYHPEGIVRWRQGVGRIPDEGVGRKWKGTKIGS
jgi:hypothetical protein